nr:hypothetical protein [Flavobacterium sp. J372]
MMNDTVVELDLDAIVNVASSAMTPSGFSAERARQFVYFFGKQKMRHTCTYAKAHQALITLPTAILQENSLLIL